jgi:hypothetical protein
LANQSPPAAATTFFAAFSSTTINDDASGRTEPTAGTGGYAAQSVSWTTVPQPTAGQPAVLANSGTVTWGPSSAAWSITGSLPVIGIYTHVTNRTEAEFVGAMGVAVARAVAAAGITLESLAGDLQFTLTPT